VGEEYFAKSVPRLSPALFDTMVLLMYGDEYSMKIAPVLFAKFPSTWQFVIVALEFSKYMADPEKATFVPAISVSSMRGWELLRKNPAPSPLVTELLSTVHPDMVPLESSM
jgi:hypothetical protein